MVRWDSKSMVGRITVISLLLVCMFVSAGEAYFCSDCGPAGVLSASPAGLSGEGVVLRAACSIAGEAHHTADTCPVCLSPSLVFSDQMPVFLTATHGVFQDPPRLSSGISIPIYKPPRIAA